MALDAFENRKKAIEDRFALDEKERLEIHARAVKLFGMWAGGQLGMARRDAETYAEKMLEGNMQNPGDIVTKVQADFKARGVDMGERLLYNQFNAKLDQSRRAALAEKF